MQNTVHFVLQAKGGIGKSFVSALLAQHFQNQGADLRCFDTDQENTTFANYKGLPVEHVPVMNESRIIDAKKFDHMMETILTSDGTFVVDTGANTFSPLLAYMVESDVMEILVEGGKKVFIHSIVGGGDTLHDTASGFNSIAQSVQAPIILWLNEHFGALKTEDGKNFTETKVFKLNQDKLGGVVLLQKSNHDTSGGDIKKMNTKRMTVKEVLLSTEFSTFEKHRIQKATHHVFDQLQSIGW